MRRKSQVILLIVTVCSLLLAGCAQSTQSAEHESTTSDTKGSVQVEGSEPEDQDSPKKSDNKTDVDLTSKRGIRSYLAGDWTLFDRKTGESFGTLSIGSKGTFEFTRLSDGAKGSGTISFNNMMSKEGEAPDGFEIKFDDCTNLIPAGTQLYGDEGTGGIFHIGTVGDEDYLYLKEIGNGDSVVSMYIFNTNRKSDGIGDWASDWLFYRKRDTENTAETVKADTFYAWAWEIDDDGDGVWLQPMTEHDYETSDEYSARRFTGAYFSETSDINAAYYGLTGRSDRSGIMNTTVWDSGYPLMMCEVSTDDKGNIRTITDVDTTYYNIYDMGSLEPKYSYNGTKFTIDNVDIDVREFAPAANAITDCKRVGDWIIVDCHVNPNIGIYLFYDIENGLMDYFEYAIEGAGLIWQGDDISTAVYQRYNDIYDFWGNHIGTVNEGQLYDLSFKDKNTIVAKCWAVDADGKESDFTEEFEYEPCDSPMLLYYEYLLGGSRQWRKLKEEAGKSTALVIVNPPENILEKMPDPVTFREGALDKVAIVPLVDNAKVTIESTAPEDLSGGNDSYTEEAVKGRAVVFDVTVSEGLPAATVTVTSPGQTKATWDVVQISGRNPQRSTFVK